LTEKHLKIVTTTDARFLAWNSPNTVWRH